MTIEIRDDSGDFISKFTSTGISIPIATPAGIIVTLTPPAGQKVMLTQFLGSGSTGPELISFDVGGSTVLSPTQIGFQTSINLLAGIFFLGGQAGVPPILGETDEVFTITSDVNTTVTFNYAYQFGV